MALGRILVVDDEAPVREVLTEYFATEGYAVEAATSRLEALSAVRGGRADLVLLDLRMPGLDRVQVLRRIRELNDRVPVIIVTADDDVRPAREAEFGAPAAADRALVASAIEAARRSLPARP